ncbi:MAG: hypothetical protein ACE5FQ_15450 [Thiogranum sp.]
MRTHHITRLITAIGIIVVASPTALAAGQHFHPKGKLPSKHTLEVFEKARTTPPFSDKQDFEEMNKGFIAAPAYKKIMADAGNVAWD